jgi:hypothetical protein
MRRDHAIATMGRRVAGAFFFGVFITALLLILDIAVPSRLWGYFAARGSIAIVLVWGPHGPVPSDTLALSVGLGINALIYALIIFGALTMFGRAKGAAHSSEE